MTRARSRHVVANTLGGTFVGIGVSVLLALYGVVSWSSSTLDLVLVLGVAVGFGVGLLPVRTVREPEQVKAESGFSAHAR